MPKPPLPDDERLSEIFKFRLTVDEKEALRKAATFYQYDDITAFVRDRIMLIVEAAQSGSGVKALYAIGQTSTSGAQRIPDLDFVPEITISNAETGEIFWKEPAKE